MVYNSITPTNFSIESNLIKEYNVIKPNKIVQDPNKFIEPIENTVSIKFYNLFLKKLRKSRRQKQKMHENFYGLRFLNKLPSAIFLISLNTDKEIIHEAKRLNIPIIAIVDSNQPVDLIDYPLLANSESLISVFFLIRLITLSLQK